MKFEEKNVRDTPDVLVFGAGLWNVDDSGSHRSALASFYFVGE